MSTAIKIGIGIAVGAGLYFFGRKIIQNVPAALNPASDKNLAYTGVNAVGQTVSGDDSWTLGGWIYDITHDDPLAQEPVFRGSGGATGSW